MGVVNNQNYTPEVLLSFLRSTNNMEKLTTEAVMDKLSELSEVVVDTLEPYAQKTLDIPKQVLQELMINEGIDVQLENFSEIEVMTQLKSKRESDKIMGIKRTLVALVQNHDVSSLWPLVVQNMIHKDLDVKRFVQIYIISISRVIPEILSLSVNSLYRELASNSPMSRAGAMRCLATLLIEGSSSIDESIIIEKCKQATNDSSPYVRMTSIDVLCDLSVNGYIPIDQDLFDKILPLTRDDEVFVSGSATSGLSRIVRIGRVDGGEQHLVFCEAFHQYFHILVKRASHFTEINQVAAIDILTSYCRCAFADPKDNKLLNSDIKLVHDYLFSCSQSMSYELVSSALEAGVALRMNDSQLCKLIDGLMRCAICSPTSGYHSGTSLVHVELTYATIIRLPDHLFEYLKNYVREFLPCAVDTVCLRDYRCYILRKLLDTSNVALILHATETAIGWNEVKERKDQLFGLLAAIVHSCPSDSEMVLHSLVKHLDSSDSLIVNGASETLCLIISSLNIDKALESMRPLYKNFLGSCSRVSDQAKVDFMEMLSSSDTMLILDTPDAAILCAQCIELEEPQVRCQMISFIFSTYIKFILAHEGSQSSAISEYYSDENLIVIVKRLQSVVNYVGTLCSVRYAELIEEQERGQLTSYTDLLSFS
eukprot:GHVH01006709.1.p1 GENE.GHVH01006709.1~~GHVH01006709.1.p1  ORF type:complete len:653 (+),score=67.40 GHVH01006709.1:82-2040(+)